MTENKYADTYLYEIMEDYKDTATAEERSAVFGAFCSLLWSSPNKRRTYRKHISFHVRDSLRDTRIGQAFHTWSEMEYMGYRPSCRETDFASLIRQKINNIYTLYFDKEVILAKEYMSLLKTPKRLYYQWLSDPALKEDYIITTINNAAADAPLIKRKYQKQKMDLAWEEYKKLTEYFLLKIFENCCLIDHYADPGKLVSCLDCITEDNFYIRYFCRSLDGYFRNFQKEYYDVKRNRKYRRCSGCGSLFMVHNKDNKSIRCPKCYEIYRRKNKLETQKVRRAKLKSEQISIKIS